MDKIRVFTTYSKDQWGVIRNRQKKNPKITDVPT